MSASEPRSALGGRKPQRPHPAAPQSSAAGPALAEPPGQGTGLVMLCVRVEPSLRRRVKLAALARGRTIQALTVEALENACRQAGM